MATAANDAFNLAKAIEALRVTRELDVNLSGLKSLHEAIRQPGRKGWQHLLSYLRVSPTCTELCNIWEAQTTVKDPRVFSQLLLLIADFLAAKPPPEQGKQPARSPSTSDHGRDRNNGSNAVVLATPLASDLSLVGTAQQLLITQALGRRLKSLYHLLGSDQQLLSNTALQLLAAIAAHSGLAARDLAAAFDWSLPALARISRPPKERPASEAGATQQKQKQRSSRDDAAWDKPNVLSRPRRAMFVRLCRALLENADHATLARLLPLRALTGALLHHVAADPPRHVLETLLLLSRRVLAPVRPGGSNSAAASAAAALPPRLRAEPFGDSALAQLAEVAASSDAPAITPAVAEGDAVATAAEAALEVLVMLCTDPANGLVTDGPSVQSPTGAPQYGPGVKRVLRMMSRLRPLDHVRHARLLNEVANRCPWLAAEFASSLPYDLQPVPTSRWVAAMTLATRLTTAAVVAPSPLLDRLAMVATGNGNATVAPPPVESAAVRAHLRCCMPAALSKAVLSRGVQHNRSVVQALTLDALAAMMRNVEPLIAAAAAMAGNLTWAQFHRRLCGAVRARLPDLQTILALHSYLEKKDCVMAEAGPDGSSRPEKAAASSFRGTASGRAKDGGAAKIQDVDENGDLKMDEQDNQDGEEQEQEEEQEEEEEEERAVEPAGKDSSGGKDKKAGVLTAAVFGVATAAEPSRVRLAVLVRLLDVIACYCRLLPDAAVDAHFDAVRLVPPDVLALDAQHQAALVGVLAAAQETASGPSLLTPVPSTRVITTPGTFAAIAAPLSTALVLPLLRLLTRAMSPVVRRSAGELLVNLLRPLTLGLATTPASALGAAAPANGGPGGLFAGASNVPCWGLDDLELRIWLWMLPSRPVPSMHVAHGDGGTEAGDASPDRSYDAVLTFLADLVVAASRRPQDGYELVRAWLPEGKCQVVGLSPLPALALRNCLRLLRSRRSGGEVERAAVCGYVTGALQLLTQQLDDPWVMVHLLERAVLADNVAAASGGASGGGGDSRGCGVSSAARVTAISLPLEGQRLRSFYDWALKSSRDRSAFLSAAHNAGPWTGANSGPLASTDPDFPPGQPEQEPQLKRRRKSSAAAEAAGRGEEMRRDDAPREGAAVPTPWGLGNLRFELTGAVSLDGDASDASDSMTAAKALSKKLQTCIKVAAKALKKSCSKKGKEASDGSHNSGSCGTMLPAAACAALADAATFASQLFTRHCVESAEAVGHTVKLLRLALKKTPVTTVDDDDLGDLSGKAGPRVGDVATATPGPREVLLAALWAFVLPKLLASCCLGPADVLSHISEDQGGVHDGDCAGLTRKKKHWVDEEEKEEERGNKEMLPGMVALDIVAGGCGSATSTAWDSQLPAVLLLQAAFGRRRQQRGREGVLETDDGSVEGHIGGRFGTRSDAASPPWALIAAGGSVPFWIPSLLSSGGDPAIAFNMVRRLLHATSAHMSSSPDTVQRPLHTYTDRWAAYGTLTRVLGSSALTALLATETPLPLSRQQQQDKHFHGMHHLGHQATQHDNPIGSAITGAPRKLAVSLVVDLWRKLTATAPPGPPGQEPACSTPNAAAATATGTAAVRAACARHIRAAAAGLRKLLTQKGPGRRRGVGDGGEVDAFGAVALLLPLAHCASAGQLLPLVQELLAAAVALSAAPDITEPAPLKRKAKANANGTLVVGQAAAATASTAARRQPLLEAGLALAGALLANPGQILGGFEIRVIGRGGGDTGADGGGTGGGSVRETTDPIDGAGVRVREVFAMVQSELVSLVNATNGGGGDGGDIRRAAELAAAALRSGLLGPVGHFLALSVTEPGLEACVRLAPYSAAAADAAAAALELGPPVLHVRFTAVLPEVVTAAEQQRPGVGRRLALARLLPAADVYTRLAEVMTSASTSVTGDEPAPASEAVIRTFREPLFAYCTRKAKKVTATPAAVAAATAAKVGRRKGDTIHLTAKTEAAAVAADGGLPADAVALLRSYAVPVLARLLRFPGSRGCGRRESVGGGRQQHQHQPDKEKKDQSGAARSLLHSLTKILPPPGVPLSLDGDKEDDGDGKNITNREVRPPLANAVEQLTLAEVLLWDGLRRGGASSANISGGGAGGAVTALSETELAAISLVLSAAAATLAALYGMGVLPSRGGSAAHRHLLATACSCLDGCVGDLLADMPDDARGGSAFAALCRMVQPLAIATAVHAAGDPAALRCLRRLLAALLPQALSGGEGGAAADAREDHTAGDVESDGGNGSSSSSSESSGSEGSATDDEDREELHAGHVIKRRRSMTKAVGAGAGDSDSADEALEDDLNGDKDDGAESDEGKSDAAAEDVMEEDEEAAEARRGILSSSSGEESDSEDCLSNGDGRSNGRSRDSTSTSSGDESDTEAEEFNIGNRDSDVEMGSAEEVTDGEEEKGRLDDKSGVPGGGDGGFLQLPYGIVPNAAAAVAAGTMLESFITSPALLTVFAPSTATAVTAALPPVVGRLPLPLVSLLSVGDLISVGTCMPPGPRDNDGDGSAEPVIDASGGDEALRTEFATLLETLLDLRLAYDVYNQYSCRVTNDDAGDNMNVGGDCGDGAARPFGHGAAERAVLSALLQLLQCAYGATLRESDRAILRVLLRLDELLLLRNESGASASDDLRTVDPVTRRLSSGPLAQSGYLWGAAACHVYEVVAAADAAGTTAASAADAVDSRALRARAVAEHQPSDPRAIALACVRFPAGRTLAADEDDPWVSPSAAVAPMVAAAHGSAFGPLRGGGGGCSTVAFASADPAWLLPFTVCCLREGAITVQDLAGWGLLPLCLRCLAIDDVGLRTLAYESLALATAQLDALASAAVAAAQSGGAAAGVKAGGPAALGSFLPASEAPMKLKGHHDHGPASASAAKGSQGPLRAAADFRRRHQLQALLAHVRNAVTAPLQRLPHISALFAAEAAVVLMQPQAPMFKPVTRLVGRRPSLDLTTPPLFNRVLAAGSPGQRHEQAWALQLLRWGALGPLDASICRRKFVPEICQALFGSRAAALDSFAATATTAAAAKAASTSGIAAATSGEVAGNEAAAAGPSLALEAVLSLSRLPSLGRHLMLHAGFAPWLGYLAASRMQECGLSAGGGAAFSRQLPTLCKPTGQTALPAVTELALETLLDLIRRRVCLRRQDGDAALSQYAQAIGMMATAAVSCRSGEMATRTCGLVVAMAAALPPWRAQPLWRCAATPEVMLQLYGVITSGGGGDAVEGPTRHRLRTWLEAVLRSSFPTPLPPASTAVAAAAAVAGITPWGTSIPCSGPDGPPTSTAAVARTGTVQRLACTAISTALALTRTVHQVRGAQQGPQVTAFHPGSHGSQAALCRAAAAVARACLLWLTSLVAAGHHLNPEGGGAAVSEALYEIVAAAAPLAIASHGAGPEALAAPAACRVTLLAHAVCQGALLAECQQESVRKSKRAGSSSGCGGIKGGDDRGLEEQEQRWLCACQRLHAVMGPSSSAFASRTAGMHGILGLRQHENAGQVQDPWVKTCWQGPSVSPAMVEAWLRAARAALAEMETETARSNAGPAAGGQQPIDAVRGLGRASGWRAVEAGLLDVLGREGEFADQGE